MRKITNFLSGFVLGGLVGATLALLLAPAPGVDLRDRVQSEVARVQAEVKQAAQDRRAEMEGQLAALRAPQKPGQA